MYKKYSELGTVPNEGANMIAVEEIRDIEHKKRIINMNSIVLIDIYGTWCVPCKSIAPLFAKMAAKHNVPGKVMLVKENVDLGLSKQVRGVPTFHFFKHGQFVHSITGADMENIENTLNMLKNS